MLTTFLTLVALAAPGEAQDQTPSAKVQQALETNSPAMKAVDDIIAGREPGWVSADGFQRGETTGAFLANRVWRAAGVQPEAWSARDTSSTVIVTATVLDPQGPDPASLYEMRIRAIGALKDNGTISGVGDACHAFSQPTGTGGVLLKVRSDRLLFDVLGPDLETSIRFARYIVVAFAAPIVREE